MMSPRAKLLGTKARRVLTAAAALLSAWAVLTVVLGITATGDDVCARFCHDMRPYAEAAAESAHSLVGCHGCHRAAGPVGWIADGIAIERRTVAAVTKRGVRPSAESDDHCRACHPFVDDSVVVSGGLAVRHVDFLEESCLTCHSGTGHVLTDRQYERYRMEDCMTCHTVSGAEPSGCSVCHVPGADRERREGTTTWRVTHGPQWKQTHGMGDLSGCVSCHTPSACARCHGVALPHPAAWGREHGNGLDSAARQRCESCHDTAWCTRCHGVEMPHQQAFLEIHGPTADRIGEDACLRCHSRAACEDCHYKASHPDVPGVGASHPGSGR